MNKAETINSREIKAAAKTLRALNHILRQKMIQMIFEKEKMTVSDIYKTLRLEQSVISQHLSVLRKEGFVKFDRSGKEKYYSIVPARIAEINSYARAMLLK